MSVCQPAAPPLVSVVIPTVGRPELCRAVRSAREQEHVPVEIVIVVDGAEGTVRLPRATSDLVDRVIWTGGGRGGSAARNAGVQAASGSWVAFLDDDDEWLPDKLVTQLALARRQGREVVVATRHTQFSAGTSRESSPLPVSLKRPDQSVAEYLFERRRPAGGRASMYTSTLMCRREVALAVPWDESLARHQDWDWLVRLAHSGDVDVVQVPRALVRVQTGSRGSISAGTSWADSLAWADRVLAPAVGARVLADFLAAQTLRYALAARSWKGVLAVLRRIARTGSVPSPGPVVIAAGGLLPRGLVERLMIAVR